MKAHNHRIFVVAVLIFAALVPSPSFAAAASPTAFVDGIYKHYRNGLDDKWSAYSAPVDAQVFEPGLVKAMHDDIKLNNGDEAGWQDVDVFCDCQDETRMRAPVKLLSATPTTALVSVDVAQEGEKTSHILKFKLVMINSQWRVADIVSPDSGSFRDSVMKDMADLKKGH